ncbi:MAG: hypothetical protein IKP88_08760 [Lachnospiraceae bacterium]|nr:hypothetical protein [Lachnospiraceae bacterium]
MKKFISAILAGSVLMCLAACNTEVSEQTETTAQISTEVSATATAEETTVETTVETTAETSEETKYEEMFKLSLEEITNRFLVDDFDPQHDGHKLIKTQMDPELAKKNALFGVKDYYRINYDYADVPDAEQDPWSKYLVYIIELDMDIFHYKKLAEGDKITFFVDADKQIDNDCVVYLIRGQYVLCIVVGEDEDYKDVLADNPAYDNVDFERACINFKRSA